MQVYKVFFQILKKQLGQIIMYLVIFLGIATIVSNQGGRGTEKAFESTEFKFACFNEDISEVSKGLEQFLEKHHTRVKIDDDAETVQDELYNRNVQCVIRIPKGFGKTVTDGKKDVKLEIKTIPGTFYEETFESMANRYLSIVKGYVAGGFSEQEALKQAAATSQKQTKVQMIKEAKGASHSKVYYYFAYLPYIFISICVVGIGPILVVFHRKEVRERNSCSSYSMLRTNIQLFAGTMTTGVLFCICYLVMVMIGSGETIFNPNGALYLLNMLSFLTFSLGLVFLLGQIVKKADTLNMMSNVIALGMSFLSGIFVPLEMLGDGIIKAAHFLPAYWYITAADFVDSYRPGEPLQEFFIKLLIQLMFGVALVSVGLAYSRIKQGNVAKA